MKKTNRQIFGDWGEQQASLFLLERGYEIVERKYRIRQGEIDIIAWHTKQHFGRTLCFIEVKTRTSDDGAAERANDIRKQERLMRTAHHYCISRNIDSNCTPIQFEHVSVNIVNPGDAPVIRWYVIIVN